jgi:hypothetical protein
MEAATYGQGTAVQLSSDSLHPPAIPTARHHRGMLDPIGRPMPTGGAFPHKARFLFILSWSRSQDFGQRGPPLCL